MSKLLLQEQSLITTWSCAGWFIFMLVRTNSFCGGLDPSILHSFHSGLFWVINSDDQFVVTRSLKPFKCFETSEMFSALFLFIWIILSHSVETMLFGWNSQLHKAGCGWISVTSASIDRHLIEEGVEHNWSIFWLFVLLKHRVACIVYGRLDLTYL